MENHEKIKGILEAVLFTMGESVSLKRLAEVLEIDPAEPRYIKAVWGQGYKIEGRKT